MGLVEGQESGATVGAAAPEIEGRLSKQKISAQ